MNDANTLQVICIDSKASTPSFDVSKDIRNKLTALGIPDSYIKIGEKPDIGSGIVICSSTILSRITYPISVIHHIDPDINLQRQNPNISSETIQYRYITEGTFDKYTWNQLDTQNRSITLNDRQISALQVISKNSFIIERMELTKQLNHLNELKWEQGYTLEDNAPPFLRDAELREKTEKLSKIEFHNKKNPLLISAKEALEKPDLIPQKIGLKEKMQSAIEKSSTKKANEANIEQKKSS